MGDAVRARRKVLGLTQASLAEMVGVSTELISRIERAQCAPSLATIVSLCQALGATPNDLLGYPARASTTDVEKLHDVLQRLPRARRREVLRIAEALARYERR